MRALLQTEGRVTGPGVRIPPLPIFKYIQLALYNSKEEWQSGRMRLFRKQIYRKVTGVRIPPLPNNPFREQSHRL